MSVFLPAHPTQMADAKRLILDTGAGFRNRGSMGMDTCHTSGSTIMSRKRRLTPFRESRTGVLKPATILRWTSMGALQGLENFQSTGTSDH